ncbi:MAG: hypothetical protein AVDCRST_MAG68-2962, partial [uncultured Gemmatimonadetes bacterium]
DHRREDRRHPGCHPPRPPRRRRRRGVRRVRRRPGRGAAPPGGRLQLVPHIDPHGEAGDRAAHQAGDPRGARGTGGL